MFKFSFIVLNYYNINESHVKIAVSSVVYALTLISAVIVARQADRLYKRDEDSSLVYSEELRGYLPQTRMEEINIAVNKIGGERIFSTYASAVEAVTNQYQPSGYDYIIHVLGDEARKDYLESFKKQDFRYASTIDDITTPYETYWTMPANWFFYRELYKTYKPAFSNGYQIYWERSESDNLISQSLNAEISLERTAGNKYGLKIKADNNFSGTCDVKLGEVDARFKNGFLHNLNIKIYTRVLGADEAINSYKLNTSFGIKNRSSGEYIPVTMINGEGYVEIASFPEENAALSISSAEINGFYKYPFNYARADNIDDENYQNGVGASRDSLNEIIVKNTAQNRFILDGAKRVKTGDAALNVERVEINDDFIRVYTAGNAADFAFPNVFEVVK
jgi:hypothetical protein